MEEQSLEEAFSAFEEYNRFKCESPPSYATQQYQLVRTHLFLSINTHALGKLFASTSQRQSSAAWAARVRLPINQSGEEAIALLTLGA